MKTPEQVATEIVNRFSWGSNVSCQGRLVGQQHVVGIAIAEAIAAERARVQTLKSALCATMTAIAGLSSLRLKPRGKVATAAFASGEQALKETR